MPRKKKSKLCSKKNEKRKKLALGTLPVSIPLSSVTVLKASIPLCIVKASDAVVKATVPDTDTLCARLTALKLVPPNWVVMDSDPLVLVKLTNTCSSGLPVVSTSLSVTIKENFEWMLTVGDHLLERGNSEALTALPSLLDSVGTVVNLLETLDAGRVCAGNPDEKFFALMDARKGVIKDVSGMLPQI